MHGQGNADRRKRLKDRHCRFQRRPGGGEEYGGEISFRRFADAYDIIAWRDPKRQLRARPELDLFKNWE